MLQTDSPKIFLLLALLLFATVLVRTAWICEDAFITFRTVDNFIQGFGLTWNVSERVQAYTHPLWMFLLSFAYFITREIYYTSLAVCALASLAAVYIYVRRVAFSIQLATLGVLAASGSKAFVDYSTSGLENSLTHLLMALFVAQYVRCRDGHCRSLSMYLFVGLALCNRMDLVLLFGPALIWAWWGEKGWVSVGKLAAGLGFFALWEAFSLVYYGFPFPNTAYAKLGIGVDGVELVGKGMHSLVQSCRNDPLTPALIVVGVAVPLVRRDWCLLALMGGGFVYVAYWVKIGGDYMSGRFMAAPFWLAILVLGTGAYRPTRKAAAFIGCGILAISLSGPYAPMLSGGDYQYEPRVSWVMDTRGVEYPHTGLLRAWAKEDGADFPDHWWAVRGRKVRAGDLDPRLPDGKGEGYFIRRSPRENKIITAWSNVGMSGYYAGPDVHIVDMIALAEPLLARLPAKYDPSTGAGHYGRLVPEGYLEMLAGEEVVMVDERLAKYREKLLKVIRGPIFSRERFKEIWRHNTGYYEALINWEFYRFPTPLEEALAATRIRPGRPDVFIRLAELFWAEGRRDDAIVALNTALANNPKSFNNVYRIAEMLRKQGLLKQSERAYERSLQLAPDYLTELKRNQDYDRVFFTLRNMAMAHAWAGKEGYEDKAADLFATMLNMPPLGEAELYEKIGDFMGVVGRSELQQRAYSMARISHPQ